MTQMDLDGYTDKEIVRAMLIGFEEVFSVLGAEGRAQAKRNVQRRIAHIETRRKISSRRAGLILPSHRGHPSKDV